MTGRRTARLSLRERQAGKWSSTTRAPITDQACPSREGAQGPRRSPGHRAAPAISAPCQRAVASWPEETSARRASRGTNEENTPPMAQSGNRPPRRGQPHEEWKSPPGKIGARRRQRARASPPPSGRASACRSTGPPVKSARTHPNERAHAAPAQRGPRRRRGRSDGASGGAAPAPGVDRRRTPRSAPQP